MQVATLTVAEMREVIALTEELLTRTPGKTDRMDLHQQLATLYSRMLSAQTRELVVNHLAAPADAAGNC